MARWKARGTTDVLLVSTAVPHRLTDDAVDLLAVVDRVLSLIVAKGRCRPVTKAFEALGGIKHWCAVRECMLGRRNGWGVGDHVLLFLEPGAELEEDQVEELQDLLAWATVDALEAAGWPHQADHRRIVDVRPVADGRGIAQYLTKIGAEMSSGAVKRGRSGETIPVQMVAARIDELCDGRTVGETVAAGGAPGREVAFLAARLREWEEASRGATTFRHSARFWSELLPEVEYRSVGEIVRHARECQAADRVLVAAAAAELGEAVGVCPFEEAGGGEPAEPTIIAAVHWDVLPELLAALTWPDRASQVLIPAVMRHRRQAGGLAALLGLIEELGPEGALRAACAVMRAPPPLWADTDGTIIVSREQPAWADRWRMIEDWRPVA